jgi:two-component system, response regulator
MLQTGHGEEVEILLVEDNENDAILTLNALRKANIRNPVQVLKDGTEALDFVFCTGKYASRQSGNRLCIILLDLNLPRIHGLDVLRRIKGDERTKGIPVIILTASQEERGVMQSYKLGAQGCVVKPFEIARFIEALSELPLGWLLVGRCDEQNGT